MIAIFDTIEKNLEKFEVRHDMAGVTTYYTYKNICIHAYTFVFKTVDLYYNNKPVKLSFLENKKLKRIAKKLLKIEKQKLNKSIKSQFD